jgi:hypothetical protein
MTMVLLSVEIRHNPAHPFRTGHATGEYLFLFVVRLCLMYFKLFQAKELETSCKR